MRTQKRDFLTN